MCSNHASTDQVGWPHSCYCEITICSIFSFQHKASVFCTKAPWKPHFIQEPEKINIFSYWKQSKKLEDRYFSCDGRYKSSNSADKTCIYIWWAKQKRKLWSLYFCRIFFLMVYTVKEINFCQQVSRRFKLFNWIPASCLFTYNRCYQKYVLPERN